MTDEEFQQIKEAEKERLRSQKRLKEALSAMKQKRRIQDIVGHMSDGARSVLRQHDSLVNRLSTEAARAEARIELALDADREVDADVSVDADASEEELEARAEALIRQLRMETRPGRARRGTSQDRTIGRSRPASSVDGTDAESSPVHDEAASHDDASQDNASQDNASDATTSVDVSGDGHGSDDDVVLPEKTIGRMSRPSGSAS